MRKRLGLIFCLLVASLCGFVGCGNDPYSSMQIERGEGIADGINQLLISQTGSSSGDIVYDYGSGIEFTVKVSGIDGNISDKVEVVGGEGYITKPEIESLGNGVSRITAMPLSVEVVKTGGFTLVVKTVEGGKSLKVDFNLDIRLDDFYLKSDKLPVVTNNYEIVLDDIEGLIECIPSISSQRDFTYSIAKPTLGASGEYTIADRLGENVIYHMGDNVDYLSEYKYAEVIKNERTGKSTLKVYPYFMTSAGTVAVDNDGNPIPTVFPQIVTDTSAVQQESVLKNCITLRAHSNAGNLVGDGFIHQINDKFIDIIVVPDAGEIVLEMNTSNGETCIIDPDSKGVYNIVLIDTNQDGGIVAGDETAYLSQRDLHFAVKNIIPDRGNLDEYEIVSGGVSVESNLPVSIAQVGNRDNFSISAHKAGTFVHNFTLKHRDYPNLFTGEIAVRFKVLNIPTNNSINIADSVVYDRYSSYTYGTKYTIDTASTFGYVVAIDSDDLTTLGPTLQLRRDGDGATETLASYDTVAKTLTSAIEGQNFSSFSSKSSFFLRHQMETPIDSATLYIVVSFSVADESYADSIKNDYFPTQAIIFPFIVKFEKGLGDIVPTKSQYMLNLNNINYLYAEDEYGDVVDPEMGQKLWDLPAGRAFDDCVKSVTYDNDLIKVYEVYNDVTKVVSLYIKYLDSAGVDKTTTVTIESFNGQKGSAIVKTYIPTAYQYDIAGTEMPLSCDVDKYSSGFLYCTTGDSQYHDAKYQLSDAYGDLDYYYTSIHELFMIVNASQHITFYDYRLVRKDGVTSITPIDITSKVSVRFDYPNYASYSNGIITTNSLYTANRNAPIKMFVTYASAYEEIDADGEPIYVPITITHIIDVLIYEPLEGVEITSSKAVDLYIDDSLGYFNKDLSEHTIISTFLPNEIQLGSQWNEEDAWDGYDWTPVQLTYDYQDLLKSEIFNSSRQEIKIISITNPTKPRTLKYKDLFQVEVEYDKYECKVHCIVSDDLLEWFNANGYTTPEQIDDVLRQVFDENIEFVVYVYIRQFNKIQNINSVRFTARYAERINELKLDIDDDGVYFEYRKNSFGQLVPNKSKIEVTYTIDNADVVNKNIRLISGKDTHFYSATIVPNATGNSGKIIITPIASRGVGTLVSTPEDNIKDSEFNLYNSNILQSFRVKVADGSSEYPFEIRTVQDYQKMIEDIANGYRYHYVISRDLNMSGYDIDNVIVSYDSQRDNNPFSLSGKHTYSRNGETITVYSSIYNLAITQEVNSSRNIGLFGYIDSTAVIDNVSVKNAKIKVTIIGGLESDTINVGILAGKADSTSISSCSVSGDIQVIRQNGQMSAKVNVGGMIGSAFGTTLSGLPGGYSDGIVATSNNVYVDIELTSKQSISESIVNNNNVGGLIGLSSGASNVTNMQVVSNITTIMRANIGGVVGVVESVSGKTTINDIYAIPSIVANIESEADTTIESLNIGGIVGKAMSSYEIAGVIVNFIDIGDNTYVWNNRTNIYATANNQNAVVVGGLVGKETTSNGTIQLSYVRSYYERDIRINEYLGNIFVYAPSGSVGGLVGLASGGSTIFKSYFDGDIVSSNSGNMKSGMLVGDLDIANLTQLYTIKYSYAIGYLYYLTINDLGTEYTMTTPTIGEKGQVIGSVPEYVDSEYSNEKFNVLNSYVVVNNTSNYLLDSNKIKAINNSSASQLNNGNIYDTLSRSWGYKITMGEDSDLNNYQWFWANNINTVKIGETSIAYPLLLNGNKVLYDLIPTNISVKINDRDGLYDIKYDDIPQVIMYLNRLASGQNDSTYYELSLNGGASAFEIKLDGAKIITTYINENNLKLYDRIEILEDSNEQIVRVSGNKIYPVSTGLAKITIRSYVVNNVKIDINVLVVYGMTDYKLKLGQQEVSPIINDSAIVGQEEETDKVYIDEQTTIILEAINKSSGYIANANYGFVLELLNADDGVGENGSINIGGRDYTYDPATLRNNILIFSSRDLRISGVKLGKVKFAITPFLVLNGVNYVDTYVSYQDSETSVIGNNVYFLDNEIEGAKHTQLRKIYCLEVNARATSISNTPERIDLSTSGDVTFTSILETANISIEQNGSLYNVMFYENLKVQINGRNYSVELPLKDTVFECSKVGDSYVCNVDFGLEYALVNMLFKKITIVKTNTDVTSRNNTYKVLLSGVVRFDGDYYRANADEYDLSSATFEIAMIPTSNERLSATTNVNIVANELTRFFKDFYTKISENDNIYSENVEDNKSQFIVPGRDGLLKITLDNDINSGEFVNSSYVTITLDKRYEGMVTLQQLSAIVDTPIDSSETGDILGYRDVISLETISEENYFGIKLSKLSINYNNNNYFNNTYFIKVSVRKSIQESDLNMIITSYVRDGNGYRQQLVDNYSLDIMELPRVSADIEGEVSTIMGKGVRKELNISARGIAETIHFNITTGSSQLTDYLFITDDLGNRVTCLNISYINSGRKYYVNQDVETPANTGFKVEFIARETILGILEETRCSLQINTVYFEIDKMNFCGVEDGGILYLKFGENTKLSTKITHRKVEVGDEDKIAEYTAEDGELQGRLDRAMAEFSGEKHIRYNDGKETTIASGLLSLYYRVASTSGGIYTKIDNEGQYGGITLLHNIKKSQNIVYEYFDILGSEIRDDTYLQLEVQYYYNSNGDLVVYGGETSASYVFSNDEQCTIRVIVEDTSTYDHPTPIEDAKELKSACGVEKGNFILVNNIELVDWVPQETKFDTLDGNGYTITIKSFDLSSIRGNNSVNAGIFSTVSEESLLKNLIIDVGNLLITETSMRNNMNILRASSKSTYQYNNDIIDLGYTQELNFGIIAGTNKGAITNAKVISTKSNISNGSQEIGKYLHILTTQGDIDGTLVVSNIGGLVGVNSETGAISNSFVGVSASNFESVEVGGTATTQYFVECVARPSALTMDNKDDELERVQIYPFILAGGNNLGGMVCVNNGIISNSYAKGLGVYNPNPTVDKSTTAGLVTYNNNVITSAFVEGNEIGSYRALDNEYRLESTGYIGGLVYENTSIIENSYANAFVQNNSSYLGGFVYSNTASGHISNSYSTAVNGNSHAIGQFVGVKQGKLQNSGIFVNCYYLVLSGETASPIEDAMAIHIDENDTQKPSLWNGFSFVTGTNSDGIWTLENYNTPRLADSLTDTISFRRIISIDTEDISTNGVVFNYMYDTYYLGTKENPLIIDKAENFDKYIIDNAYLLVGEDGAKVFGYRESESATRYVRIVNNLDFENVVFANGYKDTSLYMVTFGGVLDGNGMTLSNLNLNTKIDSPVLENFGLFGQIGYSKSTSKAVVKNINITVNTFGAKGNSKTGILAGTILNASIVNVKIDGGSATNDLNVVSGSNMAGALAGLIYAQDDNMSVSIIDVEITNVRVEAAYGSLGGTITARSEDTSKHFYNAFTIEKSGQQTSTGSSFESIQDNDGKTNIADKSSRVSYAGGVAGVILARNYDTKLDKDSDFSVYRTKSNESTISNITVSGNIRISTADNAGGLFGYVGENTLVRNSRFVVSDGQLLKANNFVGGIVGENHGSIEQCTVAYTSDALQDDNQSKFDSTILNNDRDNGIFTLFDMSEGTPYYTVAIGGIAGYSENGIILDSYVKVNVIKELSFVAGGIVGYAKGYNYLGYLYNTGAVFGRDVMGGIIGLQIVDNVNGGTVRMKNVVSLTNWNASSKDLSIRDKITKILYDNEKTIYAKVGTTGYDNFYIKMPEVGNAPISLESSLASYRLAHSQYYVGSVVGKALIRNGNGIENKQNASTNDSDQYHIFQSSEKLATIYDGNVDGVFSATLGLVSSTGDIASGDRVDDYFKTSFTVDGGEDNTINSLSYRVAYQEENGINSYDLTTDESTPSSAYLDKFTFEKIFDAQEYIPQLLGVSYSADESAEEVSSTRTPFNIFRVGYNGSDRYVGSANASNKGQFVDTVSGIWEVSTDTSDDFYYLPMYANGIVVSIINVSDADTLKSAFANVSAGKTYIIENDIILTYSEQDSSTLYHGGIKSLFVGNSEIQNPKITIQVSDSSNLASIFNLFSGAVLQNIDFDIQITHDNWGEVLIDGDNYGLLANTLEGVQIYNCNFEITINNTDNSVNFGIANASAPEANFESSNVGVLFGAVNSSTIIGSKFTINLAKATLDCDTISNFGLFAGKVSRSSFKDVKFEIDRDNVEIDIISTSENKINIGGLIGKVENSKMSNISINNPTIAINDKVANDVSVGGLFGLGGQLNLVDIMPNSDDYHNLPKVNYVASKSKNVDLALVVGRSNASRIGNVILSSSNRLLAETSGNVVLDSINMGAFVGFDESGSQVGRTSVAGSYATLSCDVSSTKLNVGGIVGYSKENYRLLTNVFEDGKITVTNNNISHIVTTNGKENVITYATTFVGGLLGFADNKVGLYDIISAGDIQVNIPESLSQNQSLRVAVGGIVGGTSGSLYLDDFASMGTLALNKLDYNKNVYESYISGVLGYNDGILSATNGYSYVELPKINTQTLCSAITSGVVSGIENVYYSQEFLGNNYDADIQFSSFAMADLYNEISLYSHIYSSLNSTMSKAKIGALQMYIPESLSTSSDECYIVRDKSTDQKGSTKFNPQTISTSTVGDIKVYNVIINDIGNSGDFVGGIGVGEGQIISGRSVSTGYVKIQIKCTATDIANRTIKYFANTNSGVISNIYLCTGEGGDSSPVALVKINNGVITHAMVYGESLANFTIAEENSGRIYACVSAIKYSPLAGETTALFGIVSTNNASGVIIDCYSSSFAYADNANNVNHKTAVYGIAGTNNGYIQYSAYSIDSSMSFDNNNCGIVQTGDMDKISAVYNSKLPAILLQRNKVWIEENQHIQIVGMKDIDDRIITNIMISVDGAEAELVKSVAELRAKITSAETYKLTYEYSFYTHGSSEDPAYKVVRISTGTDLVNYVASLTNGYIPSETIVLVTNNFDQDGASNIISISASELNRISLNSSSAIIGINTDTDASVSNKNMVLDFIEKDKSGTMEHELFNINNGLIVDLDFKNLDIVMIYSYSRFAPIYENNGIIRNVLFDNITVKGIGATYVAGMVMYNNSTGIIRDSGVTNINIYSNTWLNYISCFSTGKITNAYRSGVTQYVGNIYANGYDGVVKE